MSKVNRKISTCSDFLLPAASSPKQKSRFLQGTREMSFSQGVLTFIRHLPVHLPGSLYALSHLLFIEKREKNENS